jgi:molecular chaperone HtpG
MNSLEERLNKLNPGHYSNLEKTKEKVKHLLQKYTANFPTYTDHSIEHTQQVMNLAADLLNENEILNLNDDEIYVLCMACILHDVGMCIPEDKINEIAETEDIANYRKINPDLPVEIFIRNIHHILSQKFIINEWKNLDIPSEKYAYAISLIAQGHRKVNLSDFDIYEPKYYVKNGRDFVCLPYLSCIIRIADELDITNQRTPDILCKYYMPDNEFSQKEWNKHKSTIQINFSDDEVLIQANCSDHNMLAALEEQFNKIQDVLTSCQKIIRSINNIGNRNFSLEISKLTPKYNYIDFDPKGIKYSFDVKNVINAFVGKDLYENDNAALREAIQNALDACNYKKAILKNEYKPEINIIIKDGEIIIEDNGQGMDEFIIENYFGRLASSFYNQQEVKNEFQAIGQFGIGVFSYFLISDYIDVETKSEGKRGLKFRTDQDPNGYFHFFEQFNKENVGTKLILHLKEEFKNELTFDYLEKFIKKAFPFIENPIVLHEEKEVITISPQKFELEFDEHVVPKMYYSHHDSKSKISFDNY